MGLDNKLRRLNIIETLRGNVFPGLFLIGLFSILVVFSLNVPMRSEKLNGTLIRVGGYANPKSATYAVAYIQLDNGRTVSVPIQYGANWPKEGDSVTVIRYIKRFFGDSFGLI